MHDSVILGELKSKDLYEQMEYSGNYNIILDKLYDDIQRLDRELLITFQDSTEFSYTNHNDYKSYNWLKERIGYYPVWTMRVKRGVTKEDLSSIIQSSLCWNRQYVFFIDPSGLDTIDTYIYAWCDVHSIENYGCEEPGDKEIKEKYDLDWKAHLLMDNYQGEPEIQTLVREVKQDNIIKILDKGTSRGNKTNRMNLF